MGCLSGLRRKSKRTQQASSRNGRDRVTRVTLGSGQTSYAGENVEGKRVVTREEPEHTNCQVFGKWGLSLSKATYTA